MKMRLMEQLTALLLLLTALCGFNATVGGAQEVQEDAAQFDRFLVAVAECKTSSQKLSRVSCIIKQVIFPRPTMEYITSFQLAG